MCGLGRSCSYPLTSVDPTLGEDVKSTHIFSLISIYRMIFGGVIGTQCKQKGGFWELKQWQAPIIFRTQKGCHKVGRGPLPVLECSLPRRSTFYERSAPALSNQLAIHFNCDCFVQSSCVTLKFKVQLHRLNFSCAPIMAIATCAQMQR